MTKGCVNFAVTCIETAIADHFKVFFRDMADQSFDEFNSRNRFFYVFIIFMTIVMKSNRLSVIAINPRGGDNRTAKIAADIFDDSCRVTKVRLSIDIKPLFMLFVALRFDFFKRGAEDGFHFIKECSTESVTEEGIAKVIDIAPEAVIIKAAFGEKTVDMRIPLEIPAERMENHNKTGSAVFGFVKIEKHTGNNTVDCVKKTVEERAILEEEVSERMVNRKNTMAMSDVDEFKRHTGSAFHGVFIAAGRAETAVAAKRDKFKVTAVCAGIHGTAERRVATVDHLIDVFHLRTSGMKSIFNFLIIVRKDSL